MRGKLIPLALIAGLFASCTGTTVKKSTSAASGVIQLPDNSIALLNANSSVTFDPAFSDRTVNQTGEVFYMVVEGETPFVVRTAQGKVEVLGTEFNVRSDAEELEVEVEKGTVRVYVDAAVREVKKGQKALVRDINRQIGILKSDLKYRKWTRSLDRDVKKLMRRIRREGRKLEKETLKLGNEVKKELKKLD